MDDEFWEFLEKLIEICSIEIERPKVSAHPRFPDLLYPLDYGYLRDTTSTDGGGLDVWVGTQSNPRMEVLFVPHFIQDVTALASPFTIIRMYLRSESFHSLFLKTVRCLERILKLSY